uniref:Uncharacterized protein n=1 Tax=viral metagenome TaxID=1070528 RepID=A0A6C0CAH0_9ZZZZ
MIINHVSFGFIIIEGIQNGQRTISENLSF